ncbi:6-pyruvoyl trahydropterin synthase family protein [Marinobacter sp.]|uniref:6-pyruvoyl trahydropterin synthase family protein n=1 Tax=Marinobacter sp. TaxID=50741 RepID=UPI00384B3420
MNHLFVDNLTVIDFAYLDPSRGLVGESWIVDVVLGGELDDQGMVFDFSSVKRTIKQIIDERVDHRLAVPSGYPGLEVKPETPDTLIWHLTDGTRIVHRGPQEAFVMVPGETLEAKAVAKLLETELKQVLPANVQDIQISLREEEITGAWYHYVHGLKKHLGNCQRIAHGHRSPIEIHRNGQRDPALEQVWARRWEDIYVGSEEDVSERSADPDGSRYITFSYEANQGEFSLTMPESRVYMMTTDTTVELIASHIADECKTDFPDDTIQVRAFEGVGKGALAVR